MWPKFLKQIITLEFDMNCESLKKACGEKKRKDVETHYSSKYCEYQMKMWYLSTNQ